MGKGRAVTTTSTIREACIACIKRIDATLPQTDSAIVLTGLVNHIKETLRNALSTPSRNCEVGTAKEQSARFDRFCYDRRSYEKGCGGCPLIGEPCCELAWAQLPYEERKA